jgi:hypothetical protein
MLYRLFCRKISSSPEALVELSVEAFLKNILLLNRTKRCALEFVIRE